MRQLISLLSKVEFHLMGDKGIAKKAMIEYLQDE